MDDETQPHLLAPLGTATASGGKTALFRYTRLEHERNEDAATKYSPRRLWRETLGHGLARATRVLKRSAANADSCAARTHKLQRVPAQLVHATKGTGTFYMRNALLLQREVLCGFAATLLQIPETVAFSYVANLDPVVGLYATGFFGVIIGLAGGVPATVAGAAGALAVVMPQLTGSTGSLRDLPLPERIEHLFVAVTLAGVFQLVFGVLGFSRAFAMIPRTAHIGFLNGLALMMFLSQMTTFKVCTNAALRFGACEVADELAWMRASDPTTWTTVFVVVLTMGVMHFFPKTPVIGKMVPPTLVVALLGVAFEHGVNRPLLHYDVRTIGDTSPLAGGLPSFGLPDFAGVTNWSAVLSCAASLAAVGLFESIMTLQAVVDLTKQRLTPAACQRECIAQGVGNIVCGFFAAMGGCSMIGQSTGNVLNGGRFRLSAVVGGLTTFAVVLFASSLIELVPVACLTGILFIIIIHTFYWPSLKLIFHLRLTDAFAIVLVTALAAAINLAVAVIAGVIWQSLVNGWRSGQQLSMRTATEVLQVYHHHDDDDGGVASSSSNNNNSHDHDTTTSCPDASATDAETPGASASNTHAKVYHVRGHLLYSSIATFRSFFTIDADPSLVVVDFHDCLFGDFSAVAALREAATRYREAGKLLVARNLCAQSLDLLYHDIGWSHVDAIHMRDFEEQHDEETGHGARQTSVRRASASYHVLPSPLPHLHLVSPFSPSGASSPSTSYHVLQH